MSLNSDLGITPSDFEPMLTTTSLLDKPTTVASISSFSSTDDKLSVYNFSKSDLSFLEYPVLKSLDSSQSNSSSCFSNFLFTTIFSSTFSDFEVVVFYFSLKIYNFHLMNLRNLQSQHLNIMDVLQ